MKPARWLLVALGVVGVVGVGLWERTAAKRETARQKVREDYVKAATSTDSGSEAFQQYLALLPRRNGEYIVEGDLLLTEQQVFLWIHRDPSLFEPLVDTSTTSDAALKSMGMAPFLAIETLNGTKNYWRSRSDRKMTYALTGFTVAEREQIAADLTVAARRWEEVCPECGISFTHQPEHDGTNTPGQVTFVVRKSALEKGTLALAFFPDTLHHKRLLEIDPSFFQTEHERTGLLKHELGHILGYVHERVRVPAGCHGKASSQYAPLTSYDPKSVMHYFCDGGEPLKLDLSPLDIAGHRKQYRH